MRRPSKIIGARMATRHCLNVGSVSNTPWQIPASANIAPNNSATVMFSQAEGDFVRTVSNLHSFPSRTLRNPWHEKTPSAYFRVHQQFLELRKLFNELHNEYEKLWMTSANLLDVLCFINMESFVAAEQYEAVARQKIVSALAKQTRDLPQENQAL